MDNFRTTGSPVATVLPQTIETPSAPLQGSSPQLQPGPELAGDHHDALQRFLSEYGPLECALIFTLPVTFVSAIQCFSWALFGCSKVSTFVGGYAGGILGGACGILKASQQRLAGEESQPFTKTIRDYAIRGKSVGTIYSRWVALGPAIWLGIKVTILAAPVLSISVPLFAALGALTGVEYASRGKRSIGYRIICQVFDYTLPLSYCSGLVKDIQMAEREQKVPWYPNLESIDTPLWLQCPLPQRAVLCLSPAVLNENGITELENFQVYDYEELRSAFLNDENYVFPHNGEPVDWGFVFRLTDRNFQ